MLKLMLIYLRQKKVKKEQVSKGPYSTITFSQKKKSKTCKSHKVKDIEIPSLAGPSGITSVPISEKKKQSSKFLTQDEQFCLEKLLKKLLRRCLMKSLALLQLSFTRKIAILKHQTILRMMSSLMVLWR